MAKREFLGTDVFTAAVTRMVRLYEAGHRVVVSFSGGKDSTVVLHVCHVAAARTGRLPVEVVMRDEEVMFPGTFEYCERVANEPWVDFHWLIARQPIINVFNRKDPFWWVFDPLLPPERWVRQPPARAEYIEDISIQRMTTCERFPPARGKELYAVIGLRTHESWGRLLGLFASGGYVTAPNSVGVRNARPIYDWTDGDVWRAIQVFNLDYNAAYDVLNRLGCPKNRLRIAPPSMSAATVPILGLAAKAWPLWFDSVCVRLPGLRTAAMFGMRAVQPRRELGESWETVYQRECLDEAPKWIADRARSAMDKVLSAHKQHSGSPFPEVLPCRMCKWLGSWKTLTVALYNGDAFVAKTKHLLPEVEPEFFRPSLKGTKAGKWEGSASW